MGRNSNPAGSLLAWLQNREARERISSLHRHLGLDETASSE